jgi:hypothetical protein
LKEPLSRDSSHQLDGAERPSRGLIARVAILCVAGAASIFVYQISLFVILFAVLAWAALPKLSRQTRRALVVALGFALLSSSAGLLRLIAIDALPAMVASAAAARERGAVSRLREIVFAEDVMRTSAPIDPDHDHVGSAALITQLTGTEPLTAHGSPLQVPTLNREFGAPSNTKLGPALEAEGYLFIVCLPRAGGGWVARPGEPVDEKAAERRFVAYAWPAVATRDAQRAFFIDEHERILVSENREPGKPDEPHFAGPSFPPSCDAALAPSSAASFSVWQHKKPRANLPGDRPH